MHRKIQGLNLTSTLYYSIKCQAVLSPESVRTIPFLTDFLSLSLKFIEHLTGSTNVHVVEVSSASGGQRPPSLPRKPTGSSRPDLISPSAPPFEGKFHSANNGGSTSVLPARDTSSSKADTRYRQVPLPAKGLWTYWGYFSCSFYPPLEDKSALFFNFFG